MPVNRDTSYYDSVRVAEIATIAALSLVLANFRLLALPAGGSVSLASVPLLALAFARGPRAALAAGFCTGIGHALTGGTIVHPVQLLLDYLAAPMLTALAAYAPATERTKVAIGTTIVATAQLATYTLSGMIFFSSGIGEHSALGFALTYNAVVVMPEALLAIAFVPQMLEWWNRAVPLSIGSPVP
jgi:thiamine transporter